MMGRTVPSRRSNFVASVSTTNPSSCIANCWCSSFTSRDQVVTTSTISSRLVRPTCQSNGVIVTDDTVQVGNGKRKGMLGAYDMKREAAGAHPPSRKRRIGVSRITAYVEWNAAPVRAPSACYNIHTLWMSALMASAVSLRQRVDESLTRRVDSGMKNSRQYVSTSDCGKLANMAAIISNTDSRPGSISYDSCATKNSR